MMKTAFTSAALVIIGNVATADDCNVIDRYYPISLVAPDETSVSTQIELCKGGVATLVIADAIGTIVIGDPKVVAANLGSSRLVFLTALNIGKSDILIMSETGEMVETISLNVIEAAPIVPISVTPELVAPTEHSETEDAPDGIAQVLVYSRDLARGTRLTNEIYSWEERPSQNIPTDAFASDGSSPTIPASVQGMLLRTNVLAGDIVRPTQLVGGAAGFLSDAITPNMRAVSIRVTSDKIAGGFILPNDRVDVVHTIVRDIDGDGLSNGISNTILRNVRVLAVGAISADRTVSTSAERQAPLTSQEPNRVLSGETVTLEVNEEQARVLFSAGASGTLTLTLLALEDHGTAQIGDIFHLSEAITEPTEQQSEPEPVINPSTLMDDSSRQIIIIKGTEMGLIECTEFCLRK